MQKSFVISITKTGDLNAPTEAHAELVFYLADAEKEYGELTVSAPAVSTAIGWEPRRGTLLVLHTIAVTVTYDPDVDGNGVVKA